MTTTPEPPRAPDDESGTADDRFDLGIAFAVVAALAVAAAFGPFGWHLLSTTSGASKSASTVTLTTDLSGNGVVGSGGGAGSNGIAAIANPAAESNPATPGASPTSTHSATAGANASCTAALGNASPVSGTGTGTGTPASISAWAVMATPSVNALRANAATLHGIVTRQDATAVPTAAKGLCDEVGSVGNLAAMPDTVGAAAWQAALSAYVAGATDALAATNHPAYFQAAQAQLAQGEQELDALSARITATTQH